MATQEAILAQLERIRDDKKRKTYMEAPLDYKRFLPKSLGYEQQDASQRFQILDQIGQKSRNATLQVRTEEEARRNKLLMEQRREEMKRARRNLLLAQKNQPKFNPQVNYTGGEVGGGGRPVNGLKVGDEYLKTYTWRGHSFTVNEYVAPRFLGFLEALYMQGYRPASIGGHNERNIAGTNTPSLHSYGLAIDIDPSRNPVQSNDGSMNHALPPKVAALASKYGLSWGGSWNSYKDPMHFSVPYGGRE